MGFAHPLGVRDHPPSLAEPLAFMEHELVGFFRRHGYRLIRPPHIERLETLEHDLSGANQDQMFHLVDPERGEPLVLRPDLTPQVARHLAMHPPGEYPVRLAYSGTVFRVDHHNDLAPRERLQTGAELIGWSGVESDTEIMNLAIDCLKFLGLIKDKGPQDVVFAIGSARVLHALLDALKLPDVESLDRVLAGIQRKAYDEVLDTVRTLGGDHELAARISDLIGFPSDLDDWMRAPWPKAVGQEIKAFSENLQPVLEEAPEDLIQLDLTEVRDRSYYTGIVFEAFASGSGQPLLAGGRYDRFLEQFGLDQPAAGFALNLDALTLASSSDQASPLIHVATSYEEAKPILDALRSHHVDAAFWPNQTTPATGSWVQSSKDQMTWHFEKNAETVNGTGSLSDLINALEDWSSQG